MDLCFVPADHQVKEKLPAVSGSSGRLVVERTTAEPQQAWPGQVFADEELSYEEAMREFVAVSAAKDEARQPQESTERGQSERPSVPERQRLLKREADQLRIERRQVREQRKLEDQAWQAIRRRRKEQGQAYQALDKRQRRRQRAAKQAQDDQWQLLRTERRATLTQRQQQDLVWRQKRNDLREQLADLPVVTNWIAILVIVDNCTRQCLGLPLFGAGPKVTAEMIVAALQALLPPELQFLISDRGTHFKADAFKALQLSEDFIHVFIARHRPQSNGIAERFVRTLKKWLANKSWSDDQLLATLLQQFLDDYNDRPHQGLPISGLSPNEYANRIWVM